jgi:hypothetical protein
MHFLSFHLINGCKIFNLCYLFKCDFQYFEACIGFIRLRTEHSVKLF